VTVLRSNSTARTIAIATVILTATAARLPGQVVLEFDQSTKTFKVVPPSDGNRLVDVVNDHTFRLKRPGPVQLRVINTNTAFYTVTTDTAAVAVQEKQDIWSFIAQAKPYFPQIAAAISAGRSKGGSSAISTLPAAVPAGGTERMQRTLEVAHSLESDLVQADSLVSGPRGVNGVRASVLRALDRMRKDVPEPPAREFREALGLAGEPCAETGPAPTLAIGTNLVAVTRRLKPRADSLLEGLADPDFEQGSDSVRSLHSKLKSLHAHADTLLRDSDNLVTAAYHVENVAAVVAKACSHWESHPSSVASSAGRAFTVKIMPRTDPEITRVAGAAQVVSTVTILPPKRFVDPSLGLSVLAAPRAQYPTYDTRTPATGGNASVEIYQPGIKDLRFSWGVTLGLAMRPLDWRENNGFAVWLPELTVGQASNVVEFGIGSALSWGSVKLGGGAIWIQHSELNGQQLGDKVPNKGFLQLHDTYGKGNAYVSLSIFGTPPFTLGGKQP
jgi:hypothetical protein